MKIKIDSSNGDIDNYLRNNCDLGHLLDYLNQRKTNRDVYWLPITDVLRLIPEFEAGVIKIRNDLKIDPQKNVEQLENVVGRKNLLIEMLGKNGKPAAHNHNFDLTGLIRCKNCGCAITATKKVKHYKTTGRTVTYVYCHCTRKNKEIKCNAKPITEKELVEQINDLLLSLRPDEEFVKWAKKWLSVVHKYQASSQENILKSQQKALSGVENRLNKLLDMSLNGLLDDPTYKQKKEELEKEKRDIQRKLNDTDGTLDNWRLKVEEAVDVAYGCQRKFENGTRDQKHEVMTRIGSNLRLKDKKLLIDLEDEFTVFAEQKNWAEKYAGWLEPQEYTDVFSKTPSLRPATPVWLPGQDSNLGPFP